MPPLWKFVPIYLSVFLYISVGFLDVSALPAYLVSVHAVLSFRVELPASQLCGFFSWRKLSAGGLGGWCALRHRIPGRVRDFPCGECGG